MQAPALPLAHSKLTMDVSHATYDVVHTCQHSGNVHGHGHWGFALSLPVVVVRQERDADLVAVGVQLRG